MKFASILYKILYFDVRYCRLGACFVSKQRFRGLKSVHDFGLSHKIDDYGPIKEVRGNQTSDKASWIYWLRCGLCRLWPLGHFYTAINLFGKLFVRIASVRSPVDGAPWLLWRQICELNNVFQSFGCLWTDKNIGRWYSGTRLFFHFDSSHSGDDSWKKCPLRWKCARGPCFGCSSQGRPCIMTEYISKAAYFMVLLAKLGIDRTNTQKIRQTPLTACDPSTSFASPSSQKLSSHSKTTLTTLTYTYKNMSCQ